MNGSRNGRITIVPKYIEMPNRDQIGTDYTVEEYRNLRNNRKGKQIEICLNDILRISRIRTAPLYVGRRLTDMDPELSHDHFRPDYVTRYSDGFEFGEVKANNSRHYKSWCSNEQNVLYAIAIFERLNKGDIFPMSTFIFARYGTRDNYDMYTCDRSKEKNHSCDLRCLSSKLSKSVRDVTIVPFNFYLAMLASGKFHNEATVNQESSIVVNPAKRYLRVSGKIGGIVHGGNRRRRNDDVNDIITKGVDFDPWLYNQLGIGSMRVVRKKSPKNLWLRVNGSSATYKIKGPDNNDSFDIARIECDEDGQKRWLENFYKNHDRILNKSIGIDSMFGDVDPWGDVETAF